MTRSKKLCVSSFSPRHNALPSVTFLGTARSTQSDCQSFFTTSVMVETDRDVMFFGAGSGFRFATRSMADDVTSSPKKRISIFLPTMEYETMEGLLQTEFLLTYKDRVCVFLPYGHSGWFRNSVDFWELLGNARAAEIGRMVCAGKISYGFLSMKTATAMNGSSPDVLYMNTMAAQNGRVHYGSLAFRTRNIVIAPWGRLIDHPEARRALLLKDAEYLITNCALGSSDDMNGVYPIVSVCEELRMIPKIILVNHINPIETMNGMRQEIENRLRTLAKKFRVPVRKSPLVQIGIDRFPPTLAVSH